MTQLATADVACVRWGNDVTYKKHALAWDNADDHVYVSQIANPSKLLAPSLNPTEWKRSAIQLTVEGLETIDVDFATHISNTNNPHGTTAAKIGAYTRAQIDSIILANANEITAHESDTNNPHAVTAAQAGGVPKTGGVYTGDVTFDSGMVFINPSAGAGSVTSDVTGTFLRYGANKLGITNDGKPVFNSEAS